MLRLIFLSQKKILPIWKNFWFSITMFMTIVHLWRIFHTAFMKKKFWILFTFTHNFEKLYTTWNKRLCERKNKHRSSQRTQLYYINIYFWGILRRAQEIIIRKLLFSVKKMDCLCLKCDEPKIEIYDCTLYTTRWWF